MFIKKKSKYIEIISELTIGIFFFIFKDEFKELLEEYKESNIDNELKKLAYNFLENILANQAN